MKENIRCSKKEFFTEYLLPLLFLLALLAASIGLFRWVSDLGPYVGARVTVEGELTEPTVGRLVFGIAAFLVGVCAAICAAKCVLSGKDYTAFFTGFLAGLFLWQALGEIAWHFSVGGVAFLKPESVAALPVAVAFTLLLIYGAATKRFDFGLWCVLLSFASQWFGHFVSTGLYPLISGIVAEKTWQLTVSLALGIFLLLHSLVSVFLRQRVRRARLLSALEAYIAVGLIAFAFMEV